MAVKIFRTGVTSVVIPPGTTIVVQGYDYTSGLAQDIPLGEDINAGQLIALVGGVDTATGAFGAMPVIYDGSTMSNGLVVGGFDNTNLFHNLPIELDVVSTRPNVQVGGWDNLNGAFRILPVNADQSTSTPVVTVGGWDFSNGLYRAIPISTNGNSVGNYGIPAFGVDSADLAHPIPIEVDATTSVEGVRIGGYDNVASVDRTLDIQLVNGGNAVIVTQPKAPLQYTAQSASSVLLANVAAEETTLYNAFVAAHANAAIQQWGYDVIPVVAGTSYIIVLRILYLT